jgi:ectoine hydroxylase-related dioxygenase (phytanoyl-CoA dioxygenase family)
VCQLLNGVGQGGFVAHIDANAYTHIKDIKHLAVLVAADEMNMENGGLELVEGSHNMHIPLGEDRCIESSWIATQKWAPRDLHPGNCMHLKEVPTS